MARKTGSAKKAAKRAKERGDTEQPTLVEQEATPKAPEPTDAQAPVTQFAAIVPPTIIETPAVFLADSEVSLNQNGLQGRRRRAVVLRESIENTLGLLHDYQQQRYQSNIGWRTQTWRCSGSARSGSGRVLMLCQKFWPGIRC